MIYKWIIIMAVVVLIAVLAGMWILGGYVVSPWSDYYVTVEECTILEMPSDFELGCPWYKGVLVSSENITLEGLEIIEVPETLSADDFEIVRDNENQYTVNFPPVRLTGEDMRSVSENYYGRYSFRINDIYTIVFEVKKVLIPL